MGKIIRGDDRRALHEDRNRAAIKPTRFQMMQAGIPVTGSNINLNRGRRPNSGRVQREQTLPPEDLVAASHLFFTGGIGDFIILESYMEPSRKAAVKTITLATRAAKGIEDLISSCPPMFPNLKAVSTLKADWENKFCFISKQDTLETLGVPKLLEDAQDWSILHMFPLIRRGVLNFHKSSLIASKVADLSHLKLPASYLACNPYSPNDRRLDRDYNQGDWKATLTHANLLGIPVVVINVSDDFIPDDPRIINLNRQTSLAESIEIVKNSTCFWGIDSCLSIAATQSLTAEKIRIKSKNPHLYNYQDIYYSPHRNIKFILESLDGPDNQNLSLQKPQ